MPWYRIVHFTIMALAMLAGAVRFRKLAISSRWIFALLIITVFNEGVSYYLIKTINSNFITSYFFIPIQYILISKIFYVELSRFHISIQASIVILIVVALIITWQNIHELITIYPSLLRTLSNIFIIILCLIWLRELLNFDQMHPFTDFPLFWVSTGFLLFSIVTMFNFSAFNFINNRGRHFMLLFQYVRIGANFTLYIFLLIALLSKQRSLA